MEITKKEDDLGINTIGNPRYRQRSSMDKETEDE